MTQVYAHLSDDKTCEDAYLKLKPLFLPEDKFTLFTLNQFDINNSSEEQFLNPYDKL